MSTIKHAATKLVLSLLLLSCMLLPLPALAGGFAQQATYGGTSTGTANAQIVAISNVGSMNDLLGVTISFIPGSGLTNTGATTIAINNGSTTLTAVAVKKISSGTLAVLSGGEIVTGLIEQAIYDGTEFVLQTNYTSGVPTGQVAYYDLSSCPPGWSAANGSSGTVNVVGQFIRSLNTGSTGFDPNRTLASAQSDSVQPLSVVISNGNMHVGTFTTGLNPGSGTATSGGDHLMQSGDLSVGGTGTETRPQNVALLACQKN